VTRDEHLAAILIVSSAKRGKRHGLLMLCSGPDCGGAEMFARGLKVPDVLAAANAHIDDTEDDAAPALATVTPDDTTAIRAIVDGPARDGVTAELEEDA
jgi:uncharacterized protein (DUF983 family)